MKYTMNHVNFNVQDLAKSMAFYEAAFGLKEERRMEASDGSYIIVYLCDESKSFRLELTWLNDHPQAYDLGEGEFHLAFVSEDYEASLKTHQEMGCVCFINEAMGIYFVEDPDGYWLEVIPSK